LGDDGRWIGLMFRGVRGGAEMAPQTGPEIPPVKTTCYKTVKKLCVGVLTCLGMGPYKPLHRTRAAALLATKSFVLEKIGKDERMLVALGSWWLEGFDFLTLDWCLFFDN